MGIENVLDLTCGAGKEWSPAAASCVCQVVPLPRGPQGDRVRDCAEAQLACEILRARRPCWKAHCWETPELLLLLHPGPRHAQ